VEFTCLCGEKVEIEDGDNTIIPKHDDPNGGSCSYSGQSVRDIAEGMINAEG